MNESTDWDVYVSISDSVVCYCYWYIYCYLGIFIVLLLFIDILIRDNLTQIEFWLDLNFRKINYY